MCCTYWMRDFLWRRAGAEIVVALGQSQAALVHHGDLLFCVLEILLLAEAEESIHSNHLIVGKKLG
jgi:hypothetical protein